MSWIDREPRSLFIDGKAMVTGIGFRSEFLISKLAGRSDRKGSSKTLAESMPSWGTGFWVWLETESLAMNPTTPEHQTLAE